MTTSFRDPDGRLLVTEDRVLRVVNESGVADLTAFLASATAKRFVEAGSLVHTEYLEPEELEQLFNYPQIREPDNRANHIVEHERISFQNFPYEWPPEMLYEAGCLTIDIAESALAEGFDLKDATPYNVLFRGPRPVFVDLLSFNKKDLHDPIWLPYAQFTRTFLLPLVVNRYFSRYANRVFLTRRDGLEPETVYGLCSLTQRLRSPFLTLVSIPTWLGATSNMKQPHVYRRPIHKNEKQAAYVLERLFKRLRRQLESLKPTVEKRSTWTDYMRWNESFASDYIHEKSSFVEAVMQEFRPHKVLDVGCNTGHFSRIAAQNGAGVVAIDQDPTVVGEVWRTASNEDLDILPLVVDFTRPSPGIGWRNQENQSFLDRARNSFDALLMLAVTHHMLVTERIPLEEIIDLAADLTTNLLIIEFVAPADPMFCRLARGRDHLFKDLNHEVFIEACRKRFDIVRSRHLSRASRWLFLLRKK